MVRDTSIIAAFASLGVGRACGERVWGCVYCAGDGHVAHSVSTGDVDQRFTCIVTLACFFALVGVELERAASKNIFCRGVFRIFSQSTTVIRAGFGVYDSY